MTRKTPRALSRGIKATIITAGLIGVAFVEPPSVDAQTNEGDRVFAYFRKHWEDFRGYMQPLESKSWQVRMTALKRLADLGERALPAIDRALAGDHRESRVVAAQALMLLGSEEARQMSEKALADSEPAVRVYAIDALSMLGPAKSMMKIAGLSQDPNRDVRSHVRFARDRKEKADVAAVRRMLKAYQLEAMGTARVGKKAPDFALRDPTGKLHRLRDYTKRGAVVLVFIYGDT